MNKLKYINIHVCFQLRDNRGSARYGNRPILDKKKPEARSLNGRNTLPRHCKNLQLITATFFLLENCCIRLITATFEQLPSRYIHVHFS